MHTYGQYCALAKALDVVGSRWTLLIVRELLIRGACRYTDLRNGLPGIATNMLVDRLRELEEAGIVTSEAAPPPVATTLFRLTSRGAALEPILLQLGNWGAPLLAKATKTDSFRSHWLALPVKLHLRDTAPDRPAISIELRTGDDPVTLEIAAGCVRLRPGAARNPDLVLSGPHKIMLDLLFGKVDWAAARAGGLQHEGNPKLLLRVRAPPADAQACLDKH
jgi:DNA-binding HxlR family transcriptional regulator